MPDKSTDAARYELTDAVILAGGQTVPVRRRVGKKIVREQPLVRLVPIAEYPAFFSVLDRDTVLAEFVAAQPEGWGASLTPESINDVCDCAMDLNFQSACRWASRQARTSEAAKQMEGAVLKVLGQLSSLFASAPASALATPPAK